MQVGQKIIKELLIQSCSLQNSTQITLSATTVQVLAVRKAETLSSILFLQCGFAEKKSLGIISNIIYYDKHSLTFSHHFQLMIHSRKKAQFSLLGSLHFFSL